MTQPSVAEHLSVLILGCGNIAGGFDANRAAGELPLTHAGAYCAHGGFRLAACVDPDAARRAAFRERWNVGADYCSIDEIPVEERHFDIISICSPTALHAEHLKAAIALAPRLIFCEKPVTGKLAETAAVVELCRLEGILLAVNHTRRWAPDVIRLRDQLAAQAFGQIRSVTATYNKGLFNNGGHMVDLLLMLFGSLEVRWADTPVHDFWPADPTVPAVLSSDAGTPIYLATGHASDYALFELQIVAETVVLTMESGGASWRVRRAIDNPHFIGYKALSEGERVEGEYGFAMRDAAANIYDAVHDAAPLLSDGQSALAAQRVCQAILDVAPGYYAGIERDNR